MYRPLAVPALIAGVALGALAPLHATLAETNLVRLTPAEYTRTIHDVFGASIRVADNKVQPGFRDEGLLALGERKLTITSAELEQYEKLAQDIAVQIVEPRRRAVLVQCKPKSATAADNACAEQFIRRAGLLLLRRPLTDREAQAFVAIQSESAQKLGSFNAGLASAMSRMLVDPEFLFRVERSKQDSASGQMQLDAYSRASRLSFFLWDSAPDAELLAAAQSGKLLSQQELNQQIERMLGSPRMEEGVRTFFTDMLNFDKFATLSKDTGLYPQFTKNVQEDAQEQTLRTIVDQLLNKNAEYRDLFVTQETFLTPSLAALYGVSLPRSQELGGAVPWVAYRFADSDPYLGILSEVSFLSLNSHPARTSPTLRGKALREIFLCQKVPPPPGNVNFNLVQDTTNPKFKTVRQRLSAHASEAMCAGCHKITDPMGLSMENFTTAAGFRADENNTPIDAHGALNGKNFDGLKQLAQVIRDDPATTSCLIKRAFSYGTARQPNADERKWLADLQSELGKDGVRWRELMRRVALSPGFFVAPGEQPLSADAGH
ncbi:MAG TPA: DUF1592 domain-containing protein [Steroidobacteraceae bacterium]